MYVWMHIASRRDMHEWKAWFRSRVQAKQRQRKNNRRQAEAEKMRVLHLRRVPPPIVD